MKHLAKLNNERLYTELLKTSETGDTMPSNDALADRLGVNPATVAASLKRLHAAGRIQVIYRGANFRNVVIAGRTLIGRPPLKAKGVDAAKNTNAVLEAVIAVARAGDPWPGNKRISTRLNVSEPTVRNALVRLEQQGRITVETRATTRRICVDGICTDWRRRGTNQSGANDVAETQNYFADRDERALERLPPGGFGGDYPKAEAWHKGLYFRPRLHSHVPYASSASWLVRGEAA